MKTRNIYKGAALLAMALTTAACQNELNEETNQPKPGEKITMTIRATQSTTPQTRTEYEDKLGEGTLGSIVVKWEQGTNGESMEKIKVFGYDTTEKFTDCGTLTSTPSSRSTDGTSITFTGTDITEADNYIAIYPVDNCELKEGALYFDFSAQAQDCTTGKEMAHLKKYDIMLGEPATGTNNYSFTHEAIMLRFDLTLPTGKTEVINKVTLTTSITDGLSTGMVAMLVTNSISFLPYYDTQSISLGITNHTASNSLKAYMMMPPFDASDATLTVTVNTVSGNIYTGTLNTTAGTELTKSNCYTLKPTLTVLTEINIPTVEEGKLENTLKDLNPAPTQTELALSGKVNQNDLTALATFLKEDKAKNITTLDLSDLTLPTTEVKGFTECTSLISVKLPYQVEAIGDDAFNGCTKLTTVTQQDPPAPTSVSTRASMPGFIKKVGARAFKGTAITEMFLHAKITNVGANAFENCTALKALVFEGTIAVDSGITLGTDIVKGSENVAIFLPMITDATTATTYKKALGKDTFYKYDGENYSDDDVEIKIASTNYTPLPNGPGATSPGMPGGEQMGDK